MNVAAPGVVERLYRRHAGQVVAALTRRLGAHHLALAEDAVQDAFTKAINLWRYQGAPANPRGWLYRVAYHRALDTLRRDEVWDSKIAGRLAEDEAESPEPLGDEPLNDDELALVFLCCHPALSPDSRVALTLRVACGFDVREIGAALFADPTAVAQRIVRAKRTLRDREADLGLPAPEMLPARLDGVLTCLYLLFSEGFNAHTGDAAVRGELCNEAIRLGELLAAHPATRQPQVHALLALMYCQSSRLEARCRHGELIVLEAQDPHTWDGARIATGMRHLAASAAGDVITRYHVEAAIAAEFVSGAPDWPTVLRWYDQLQAIAPSPVVRLNRAVAIGKVAGARAALRELEPLREIPAMRRYYLLAALLGVYYGEIEDPARAAAAYRTALRLGGNEVERRLIESRLAALPVAVGRTG